MSKNGTKDFDYTGVGQCAILTNSGYYKLEVWGAQGGNARKAQTTNILPGGYGGYSVGLIRAGEGDAYYIYVGEGGTFQYWENYKDTSGFIRENYNGGGGAKYGHMYEHSVASGGGATHIATVQGQLKELSQYRDTIEANISNEIIIVAGGGGGAFMYRDPSESGNRNSTHDYLGNGGGYIGSTALHTDYGYKYALYILPTGGTQNAGGECAYYNSVLQTDYCRKGSFGKGGSVTEANSEKITVMSGSGGGWYGGTSTTATGAPGGSGYIGSSNLISGGGITKHMTCYSCTTSTATATRTNSNTNVSATATADYSKTGNGYARITYLGTSI